MEIYLLLRRKNWSVLYIHVKKIYGYGGLFETGMCRLKMDLMLRRWTKVEQ